MKICWQFVFVGYCHVRGGIVVVSLHVTRHKTVFEKAKMCEFIPQINCTKNV